MTKKKSMSEQLSAYRASLNRAKRPPRKTTDQELIDHCKNGGNFLVKRQPGRPYLKYAGKIYPFHSTIELDVDSPILSNRYVELPAKLDDHERRHNVVDYARDVIEPVQTRYNTVIRREQDAISRYAQAQTMLRDAAQELEDAQKARADFEAGPMAEALENAPLLD